MLTQLIRAAWRSRGFIVSSVRREFAARYQNSLLGAAWTVLNPLAMIVVYTVCSRGDAGAPARREQHLRLQHLPLRRRADLGLFADIFRRA